MFSSSIYLNAGVLSDFKDLEVFFIRQEIQQAGILYSRPAQPGHVPHAVPNGHDPAPYLENA